MLNATQRITRARAGMVLNAPFYATLALGMEMIERDDIDTMATDGKSIFYSAKFVDGCSDAELRGVLAHEVMHVANLHHTRRGNHDAQLWNCAADYAINEQLIKEGFVLPAGGLIDARYNGQSAERIYTALANNPGNRPGTQPGGVLDAPAADAAELQAVEMDIKAKVIQAAQAARAAGKESAGGTLAAGAIKKPVIDWRHVLRRYVDAASRVETAWHRPNRRHVAADLYMPGKVPDGMARLAVVIDTSGSINTAAFSLFMAELQGAIDDAAPELVDVIQCDSKVTRRDMFHTGGLVKVNLCGGGGTDMQPALDLCRDASVIVCFTDCEFGVEPKAHGVPVLWARWGGAGRVPSEGELIDLPDTV